MNTITNLGHTANVLKIFPSALLILFVYVEHYELLTFTYKIGYAELLLLMATLSYPLGTVIQQLSISVRGFLLKGTKYSDQAQIARYMHCEMEEFWIRYVKFYSEANPKLISMVQQENLNKFFFLNMATITLISFFVHIVTSKQIVSPISLAQLLFVVIFIRYHFKCQDHYHYVLNLVTRPKKYLSKINKRLPLPPAPPKLK
jgi:hypothetical protein